MLTPGTYMLNINLSSTVIEMTLKQGDVDTVYNVIGSGPPFDVKRVVVRDGEFYFYDADNKEFLERWEEGDIELQDFFKEKDIFIRFLKCVSPVKNWIKI